MKTKEKSSCIVCRFEVQPSSYQAFFDRDSGQSIGWFIGPKHNKGSNCLSERENNHPQIQDLHQSQTRQRNTDKCVNSNVKCERKRKNGWKRKEAATNGHAREREGRERVPRRLLLLLLLRIHKSFPTPQSTSTRTATPCPARLPASQFI